MHIKGRTITSTEGNRAQRRAEQHKSHAGSRRPDAKKYEIKQRRAKNAKAEKRHRKAMGER